MKKQIYTDSEVQIIRAMIIDELKESMVDDESFNLGLEHAIRIVIKQFDDGSTRSIKYEPIKK